MMPIALTVDVHAEDRPADVGRAAAWLHEHGIPATFFVPSALFEDARFRPHVIRLPSLGFEVGSHGHDHDFAEIRALMRGAGADLDFLRRSHALYQDTFGGAPISFRSPAWCPLGPGAIAALVELGYRVDSSATPQRLPIFSSTPYANTWLFARRTPYELAPGLLEVPTSCLLLPAASPTWLTLRRRAASAFLRLLLWEARHRARSRAVRAAPRERLRARRRAAVTGRDAGSAQLSAAAGWRAALQGISARTQSGARICDARWRSSRLCAANRGPS